MSTTRGPMRATKRRRRKKRASTTFQPTPHDQRVASDTLMPGQLAVDYGIKKGTLSSWRARGCGPPYHRLTKGRGGVVMYNRGAFEAWLAACEVRPGGAA